MSAPDPQVAACPPVDRALRLRAHLACCATILLATWLVYFRAAGFGYVGFDDTEYVVNTPRVLDGLSAEGVAWAFTTFRFSNWHPLTWVSYMLDVSLFGDSAGAKHAVNIVLHACNSLLAYALAFRLLPRSDYMPPLAVGVLFAVHPLHVESVAWVAERKDVLCALFYFAALHLHLHYVAKRSAGPYLAVQIAGAFALLAKPMAVTLPVALLLLDHWPLARLADTGSARARLRRIAVLLIEKVPLVLMAAAVCVLTVMAQQDALVSTLSVWPTYRLQNAILSYTIYLRQMILPTGLAPLYPLRPIDALAQFLPALCVLAALVGFAVWRRRVAPWGLFGMLWFLLTLLPVIGLVQVGVQAHADRYMYIPSLGLLLVAGMIFAGCPVEWRSRARAIVAAVLVFHSVMAWIQVGYWANNFMAYSRILDITPDSWEGHVGMAAYYSELGALEMAESHAREALAIDSRSQFVHASLGNIQLAKNDFTSAETSFRRSLEINPRWTLAMNNLAVTLERSGRPEEAMQWYCKALTVDPELEQISESISRLRATGVEGCRG